ncbi:MAG: hypothetical protein AAF389_14885 [Gemmatimonadota bacterium]
MTVAELRARMTWAEFVEWLAWFKIQSEPKRPSVEEILSKVAMVNARLGGKDLRGNRDG